MKYDIDDVAKAILGINIMEDIDEDLLEEKLVEELHTDTYHLDQIVKPLLKGVNTFISPITNEPYIAIVNKGLSVCSKRDENFITNILIWMSEGKFKKKDHKGFKREITDSEGNVEFELILKRVDNE